MKAKINHIRWGLVLTYVSLAVNILVSILYTPLVLRILGQSEHGLYSTVSTTMSWLSLLGLGIGSSYIYFFARYRAKKDEDAIASLNGLFLLIFLIIGAVSLLCGLAISSHLRLLYSDGLSEKEYETARTLAVIVTINLSVGFPASVFSAIIRAHEKYIQTKLAALFQNIFAPLLTLPLLFRGFGSVGMVTVSTAVALIAYTFNAIYCFKVIGVRVKYGSFERGIIKAIFSYSAFIALNSLIDKFSTGLDKLFITRYWNTAEASVYAIGYSLYTYYSSFSWSTSGVFATRIQKITASYADNREALRSHLTDQFIRLGRIQFLIQMLMLTGIIFFGREFIHLWAERGGQDYSDSYLIALLLCASKTIPLIQNIGGEIQRAQNKHRFRTFFYAIMTLLNVLLTIVFCQRYGAIGAAVGTAVSTLIVDNVVMNIYYHKALNIDMIAYWKQIGRMIRGLLIPLIVGFALWRIQSNWSITMFVLAILCYSAIYAVSMVLFAMNREEKDLCMTCLKKIWKGPAK